MKPGEGPAAKLVAISESEIVELAQFVASQSGHEPTGVESHLRWFLLDNPARDPAIPLGCGLRSPQGELVGCILQVPQIFFFFFFSTSAFAATVVWLSFSSFRS